MDLRRQLYDLADRCREYVKLCKAVGSRTFVRQYVDIAMRCWSLYRHRGLKTSSISFEKRYAAIVSDFDDLCSEVIDLFPNLDNLPFKPPSSSLSNRAIKVSITLREDQWEQIDNMIEAGYAGSRSEYFRKLHNRK